MKTWIRIYLSAAVLLGTLSVWADGFAVEKTKAGVTVKYDGKLFTRYVIGQSNKPFLWPVIGPSGDEVTRAFPMEKREGERHDHPHHRSVWFGHQGTAGFDTWHEPASGRRTNLGSTDEPLLEKEDFDLGIIGQSAPMQEVFKTIGQLAASDATALITGESGTGKELVARAIYSHSQRSSQSYLAINCAAIPENLLESELFGHEKGAFTGANTQRIGKFEQCDGGTIFLDEIGDMTLATQTKILRVLQNGIFERVGGNQPVKVDVRVIAATNKPLEKAVEEGEFREDLFYRLNVVRIQLPALRERREDIPQLVSYFLSKNSPNPKQPKTVQPDALAKLETHDWPGNVRELENAVQRALVMAKGDAILLENLPPEVLNVADAASPDVDGDDLAGLASKLFRWARNNPDLKVIPAVERELVINALKETDGNQVQSAKLLGITRATLRKRIEKFDIKQGLTVE